MWRTITEDDLFAAMNSAEIAAVRSVALEEGQSDPVAEVIAQVAAHVREMVRSCRDNRLHPDPACVPAAAILHAVPIVRHRLASRFPGLVAGDGERLEEYRAANRYLESVAACRVAVERHGAEEDAPAPQPGPSINARRRRFTREDQEGI